MDRSTPRHHTMPHSNPGRRFWIGAAAFTVGAVGIGLGVWDHFRSHTPKLPKPPMLPPPKQGGGAPTLGGPCSDPVRYPGFVSTAGVCKPGPLTPPGVYMLGGCTDFVFVKGDTGPQATALDNAVTIASKTKNADPTTVITKFLKTRWPECTWPPLPNAPARVVQMWMALSVIAGRMIIARGGTVLGTTNIDDVDAQVAERFQQMGYTLEFDPTVVPELELPDIEPEPQPEPDDQGGGGGGGGGGGVFPPEPPPPGPGYIDFGQGGPAGPHGHVPEPEPSCAKNPYVNDVQTQVAPAEWTESKYVDIPLFTPSSNACEHYDIRFGVCVTPINGTFGWLDSYFAGNESAQLTIFQIRNAQDQPLESYDDLRLPILWKQQYRCRVRYAGNKLSLEVGGLLTPIDDSSVDACPTKAKRWPGLPYKVQPAKSDTWRFWNPIPSVSVHTSGKTLYARVTYSGLVQFVRVSGQLGGHPQNYGRAMGGVNTRYLAQAKIWALGSK